MNKQFCRDRLSELAVERDVLTFQFNQLMILFLALLAIFISTYFSFDNLFLKLAALAAVIYIFFRTYKEFIVIVSKATKNQKQVKKCITIFC